jgi:hypothetical protein
VRRVFVDGENSRRLAKDCHRSVETVRRRCRNACRELVADQTLPKLPPGDGPLVLMADGMWFRFGGKHWVVYNMAVKPVGMPLGFFLDPVMLEGRECARLWLCALATVPPTIHSRVRGLVADGFLGCKAIACRNRWVLQQCHRHLDAKLLGRLGRRRRVRGEVVRTAALEMIREVRTTTDPIRMATLQHALAEHARRPELTSRIAGAVRRFLHDVALFRAYLDHPELELPTTTNAVESRHSQLRGVVLGANNPQAAILRIKAYLRLHPSITCNGHKIQQI